MLKFTFLLVVPMTVVFVDPFGRPIETRLYGSLISCMSLGLGAKIIKRDSFGFASIGDGQSVRDGPFTPVGDESLASMWD